MAMEHHLFIDVFPNETSIYFIHSFRSGISRPATDLIFRRCKSASYHQGFISTGGGSSRFLRQQALGVRVVVGAADLDHRDGVNRCSSYCLAHLSIFKHSFCELKHTVFPIGRSYSIDSIWQRVKTNDIQCWLTFKWLVYGILLTLVVDIADNIG